MREIKSIWYGLMVMFYATLGLMLVGFLDIICKIWIPDWIWWTLAGIIWGTAIFEVGAVGYNLFLKKDDK